MQEISLWLQSMGIPPLLAGLIVGVLIGNFLGRKASSDRATPVLGGTGDTGLSKRSARRRTATRQAEASEQLEQDAAQDVADSSALSRSDQVIVLQLMRQERKIDAIKHVREYTGLGLAEAKNFVEKLDKASRL